MDESREGYSLKRRRSSSPHILYLFLLSFLFIFCSAQKLTDPGEVAALKVIAERLNIRTWDFNMDPCSKTSGWDDPVVGVICNNPASNMTFNIIELRFHKLNYTGTIPVELANFTRLVTLWLGYNLFTGTIPLELFRLKTLENLDLGINRLSGPLPPQITNLTNLKNLGIGSNNFSGTFPLEIMKLQSLQGLYMDNSQMYGAIPPEISNLTNLQVLWIFGNHFTGAIPGSFGRLSQLKTLKMYGMDIQGLPSSFWNLKSLEELTLGDISLDGPIPSTIRNLAALMSLTMRNCGLNGSIPVEIGMLKSITYLDLSFNNLMGVIPDSIANLTGLQNLLLTDNMLTGSLPSGLGDLHLLIRLYISNNELSGVLPTWLNKTGLDVNLIWNFFDVNNSDINLSSTAFNCPLNNPHCNEAMSRTNVGFAINCGGPEISSAGTMFDHDNHSSSFFVHPSNRWAVSTVGHVPSNNFDLNPSTNSSIRWILSPSFNLELYQTARGSPNSLRYYGMNMGNGIYNIELHFAEISLTNEGWPSLGRRIFDVYIQEHRFLEDFNIREAGNGSLNSVIRSFKAPVKNHFLVIHFLWTGKGSCCSPIQWTYGPLISAIRVSADFSMKKKISGAIIAIVVVGVIVCLSICIFLIICRRRRGKRSKKNDLQPETSAIRSDAPLFTIQALRKATHNFSLENKIGEGSFGSVYKGVLSDGNPVAIKILFSTTQKGIDEFMNEVATLLAVKHRNLVKLLGLCRDENQNILVFEYLENNSVYKALFDSENTLDWPTRFKICIGVARGLAYLHEDLRTRIIHRDIKASNVLLDRNNEPKIADFGLAKLLDDNQSHLTTRIKGTHGYLAPEYMFRGQVTEKADIYSFAILILELVSGRKSVDARIPEERMYLLEWTWKLYEDLRTLELVDSNLEGEFNREEALRVIQAALLCTQAVPEMRPKMSQVISILTGNIKFDATLSRPAYLQDLREAEKLAQQPIQNNSSASASSQNPVNYPHDVMSTASGR